MEIKNNLNNKSGNLGFIRPLSRKSQGHIEVILSFSLFIGAILFIFLFITPSFKDVDKTNIEQTTDKVINNMSLDIGRLSIISDSNCYNYTDDYGVSYVETKKDNEFIIYFSDEEDTFNNTRPNKNDVDCLDYNTGVFSEEDVIVYNETVDFKAKYESDYEKLKEDIGISDDFSFQIKDINGQAINELSASRNIPGNVNVKATEFPIRVIDRDGIIHEFLFNIRVWKV